MIIIKTFYIICNYQTVSGLVLSSWTSSQIPVMTRNKIMVLITLIRPFSRPWTKQNLDIFLQNSNKWFFYLSFPRKKLWHNWSSIINIWFSCKENNNPQWPQYQRENIYHNKLDFFIIVIITCVQNLGFIKNLLCICYC